MTLCFIYSSTFIWTLLKVGKIHLGAVHLDSIGSPLTPCNRSGRHLKWTICHNVTRRWPRLMARKIARLGIDRNLWLGVEFLTCKASKKLIPPLKKKLSSHGFWLVSYVLCMVPYVIYDQSLKVYQMLAMVQVPIIISLARFGYRRLKLNVHSQTN